MLKDRNKDAIVHGDKHYSYTNLLQYSLRYSEVFASHVKRPNKILIFAENSPEYIFGIYGTLRLNAIVVPVDVMSTQKELGYMINDCRPDIILTTSDRVELIDSVVSEIANYAPPILAMSEINTERIGEMPIVEMELGDKDQVVSIIYTSGTTGSPKGVMLTYENYWYNLDAVMNQVPIFSLNENVILLLPLHHVFPFAGALLAPIYVGSTIHIVPNLAPETILKTLQDGKISIIVGVPRLYDALAKGIMNKIKESPVARTLYKLAKVIGSRGFSKAIFKSVHEKFGGKTKYMICGGAALSAETGTVFKTLGFEMLEGFGMTECAPMITFTRPGDWKIGYCGKLLKGLELKFSDDKEILVKGPNVMKGYYNRPEETAAIIRDGWLHTGDVGEFDSEGRLKITGRIKEIIVTPNGKNINPVEIEHSILADADVVADIAVFLHEDVLQAIVIPDIQITRVATGYTIDELVRKVIENYNASAIAYKRIMKFHITSQELPKTRLGKVQRYMLSNLINQTEKRQVKEDLSSKSDIYLALKKFIEKETNEHANGDDHFEIDLALDSLGRVSLLAYIADNFNVSIEEKQMVELSSLNKLSAYVEREASNTSANNVSWKQIFEETETSLELPKSGFIHWLMFQYVKLMSYVFFRFKKRGTENIPKEEGCIYVANHRSGLDPAFLMAALNWKACRKLFFFAKIKHFKTPIARFFAKRNNTILVDVNTNIKISLSQMYKVLKQGKSIVIFPEGTRSKDGVMKEFKESFAILSNELQVPVVPIVIDGTERVTYNSVRLPKFMAKIVLDILPAVTMKSKETTKEFTERVKSIISEKLN